MRIKTPFCNIEIEIIFIIIILTSIMSKELFKFLYYFFACYLFIFFHELMHIAVACILDKNLIKVKFSISGVCAVFEKKKEENVIRDICIYLAGPISNLILAYIFKSNAKIYEINIFLSLINLIPVFPLDGYNVVENILKLCRKEKYVMIIGNISIVIFMILSTYLIVKYKNYSFFVFSLYLLNLRINDMIMKKRRKYV